MKSELLSEVEKHFRPEFLNRLDEIIVFESLSREDMYPIVEIELRHVMERLAEKGLKVVLEDDVREFLIEKGFNQDFGARPLRRAVERQVEDPLAEEMLRGSFGESRAIRIFVKGDRLGFEAVDEPTPPKKKEAPAIVGATSDDEAQKD